MKAFDTINPENGEKLQTWQYHSDAEIDQSVATLEKSYKRWSQLATHERTNKLKALAQELRKQKDELAKTFAQEMGKPLKEGLAEIEKSASTCEHFADRLEEILRPQIIQDSQKSQHYQIIKQPLGALLAIMPWNYPLWQLIRFAVPAIGAGNTVLLKHSDQVAQTAESIAKIFAGVFDDHTVLKNVRMTHEQAAKTIADFRIKAVTFTGSTQGGRKVAALAGQHLKKSVLELGGSDAYLILKGADINKAAKICAQARLVNAGQSCVAAKRFVVDASIYEEFSDQFRKELVKPKMGSPLDAKTDLGPLSAQRFQKQVEEQVQQLIKNNARLIFGGKAQGYAYFEPSMLEMSQNPSELWCEEIFGPVALVWKAQDHNEAIKISNHSTYGLGGAVFTEDMDLANLVVEKLECGMVGVNESVKSDARVPFGGVKDSGYGKELGDFGAHEFLNIKVRMG